MGNRFLRVKAQQYLRFDKPKGVLTDL